MRSYFSATVSGMKKIADRNGVNFEDLVCMEPTGGVDFKCFFFSPSSGEMEECELPELAEDELEAIAILGANGALGFTQDRRTSGQYSHLDGEEFREKWQEVTITLAKEREERAIKAWQRCHTAEGVELAPRYTEGPKIETTHGVVRLCKEAERPFREFFFSPKTGRPVFIR